MENDKDVESCDIAIIGAGPSGLSAATYASSEGLSTLLFDKADHTGGQAYYSTFIENYLGFPKGLSGKDLMTLATEQAVKFGTDIRTSTEIQDISKVGKEFALYLGEKQGTVFAKSLLLTLGVFWRKLQVPGIDSLVGRGVYYGDMADHSVNDTAIVVGGGNSAAQLALNLASRIKHVTMLIRADNLAKTASAYLANRISESWNIGISADSEIVRVFGIEHLEGIVYRQKGKLKTMDVRYLYVMIGNAPQTTFLGDLCTVDAQGYIVTDNHHTSCAGIFSAGDVRSGSIKRVASAVGEGAASISQVHTFLGKL